MLKYNGLLTWIISHFCCRWLSHQLLTKTLRSSCGCRKCMTVEMQMALTPTPTLTQRMGLCMTGIQKRKLGSLKYELFFISQFFFSHIILVPCRFSVPELQIFHLYYFYLQQSVSYMMLNLNVLFWLHCLWVTPAVCKFGWQVKYTVILWLGCFVKATQMLSLNIKAPFIPSCTCHCPQLAIHLICGNQHTRGSITCKCHFFLQILSCMT